MRRPTASATPAAPTDIKLRDSCAHHLISCPLRLISLPPSDQPRARVGARRKRCGLRPLSFALRPPRRHDWSCAKQQQTTVSLHHPRLPIAAPARHLVSTARSSSNCFFLLSAWRSTARWASSRPVWLLVLGCCDAPFALLAPTPAGSFNAPALGADRLLDRDVACAWHSSIHCARVRRDLAAALSLSLSLSQSGRRLL